MGLPSYTFAPWTNTGHQSFNLVVLIFAVVVLLTSSVVSRHVIVLETDEEYPVGTLIGRISDRVEFRNQVQYIGDPSLLRYSFLTEGYPNTHLFHVGAKTGDIINAVVLDRESLCLVANLACHLDLLVAIYSAPGDYFHVAPVHILLHDINDNAPQFQEPDVTLRLPESTPVGTKFRITHAVDPDRGLNSVQSYTIRPENGIFQLEVQNLTQRDSELSLVLKRQLDHESAWKYSLSIVAKDGGYPALFGVADITIEITDINDNRPKFTHDVYQVTISEDITVPSIISYVSATDSDSKQNAQLTYQFSYATRREYSQEFLIDNATGVITLVKPLDYETKETYELIVECSDSGNPPQVSQTIVVVSVQDVNDNQPAIYFNLIFNVPEDTELNELVAHVTVSDPDSEENGHVTCNLNITDFRIERIYGNEFRLLLNRILDMEITPVIYGLISCEDNGTAPLKSNKSFQIEVKDVNDHVPQFQHLVYKTSIEENCPMNTTVIQIRATDQDYVYGVVTYHLSSVGISDSIFSIDSATGTITTADVIDREVRFEYVLEVIASDNGQPPRSATTSVTITVLDQNDNPPEFKVSNAMWKFSENMPPGTAVGLLSASDDDIGFNGRISYTFSTENMYNDIFTINSQTGVIRTKHELDRETQAEYYLIIDANDMGTPSLTSTVTVTIHISDNNDNAPIVTFPSKTNNEIDVTQPLVKDTILTTIQAHDLDIGSNARLLFSISKGNRDNMFRIHKLTGELYVARTTYMTVNVTRMLEISVRNPGSRSVVQAMLFINIKISSDRGVILLKERGEAFVQSHVIIIIVMFGSGSLTLAIFLGFVWYIRTRRNRKGCMHRDGDEGMDAQGYIGNTEYTSHKLYSDNQNTECTRLTFDPEEELYVHGDGYHANTSQSTFSSLKRSITSLEDSFMESPQACSSFNGVYRPACESDYRVIAPESCYPDDEALRHYCLKRILHSWMTKKHRRCEDTSITYIPQLPHYFRQVDPIPPDITSSRSSEETNDSGRGKSEDDNVVRAGQEGNDEMIGEVTCLSVSTGESSTDSTSQNLEKHVRFDTTSPHSSTLKLSTASTDHK